MWVKHIIDLKLKDRETAPMFLWRTAVWKSSETDQTKRKENSETGKEKQDQEQNKVARKARRHGH